MPIDVQNIIQGGVTQTKYVYRIYIIQGGGGSFKQNTCTGYHSRGVIQTKYMYRISFKGERGVTQTKYMYRISFKGGHLHVQDIIQGGSFKQNTCTGYHSRGRGVTQTKYMYKISFKGGGGSFKQNTCTGYHSRGRGVTQTKYMYSGFI